MLARFHADWRSMPLLSLAKQKSLMNGGFDFTRDHAPRAFVRNDRTRIYFQVGTNFFEFTGNWGAIEFQPAAIALMRRCCAGSKGFRNTDGGKTGGKRPLLRQRLRATGDEFIRRARSEKPRTWILLPGIPGGTLLFRDKDGLPRVVPVARQPSGVIVDRLDYTSRNASRSSLANLKSNSLSLTRENRFRLMRRTRAASRNAAAGSETASLCPALPSALYDSPSMA